MILWNHERRGEICRGLVMAICWNCGNPIAEGTEFCPKCKTKVIVRAKPASHSLSHKAPNRNIIIGLATAFVCLLLLLWIRAGWTTIGHASVPVGKPQECPNGYATCVNCGTTMFKCPKCGAIGCDNRECPSCLASTQEGSMGSTVSSGCCRQCGTYLRSESSQGIKQEYRICK
jgi:hypothetical protein